MVSPSKVKNTSAKPHSPSFAHISIRLLHSDRVSMSLESASGHSVQNVPKVAEDVSDVSTRNDQLSTVVGRHAASSSTGLHNSIVGYQAGFALARGSDNVLVGNDAGYALNNVSGVVAVGAFAGSALRAGAGENTIVGARAGTACSTGSRLVLLGANAGAHVNGVNSTIIGYSNTAVAEASSNTFSVTSVGAYSRTLGYHNVSVGSFNVTSDATARSVVAGTFNQDAGTCNVLVGQGIQNFGANSLILRSLDSGFTNYANGYTNVNDILIGESHSDGTVHVELRGRTIAVGDVAAGVTVRGNATFDGPTKFRASTHALGNVRVDGAVEIAGVGCLDGCNGVTFCNAVNIRGPFSVTDGDVAVGGATYIQSTLRVNGQADLRALTVGSNLSVNGALHAGNTFVSGSSRLTGELHALASACFYDTVDIEGHLKADTANTVVLQVESNALFQSGLTASGVLRAEEVTVTGDASVRGSVHTTSLLASCNARCDGVLGAGKLDVFTDATVGGATTLQGPVVVHADLTATRAEFNDNVKIHRGLVIQQALAVGGTFTAGAAHIQGPVTLGDITGKAANFIGRLSLEGGLHAKCPSVFEGDVSVRSNVRFEGDVSLARGGRVDGPFEMRGGLVARANTLLEGQIVVCSNAAFESALSVAGPAQLAGELSTCGHAWFHGPVSITGELLSTAAAVFEQGIHVHSSAVFDGPLSVASTIGVHGLQVVQSLTAGGPSVFRGPVRLEGSLASSSHALFQSGMDVQCNASFHGPVSLHGEALGVDGRARFGGQATFEGNVHVAAGVTTGGNIDIQGDANIDGDVVISGALQTCEANVRGTAHFGDDVDVHGLARFHNAVSIDDGLQVSGTMSMQGQVHVEGNVTLAGALSVTGATQFGEVVHLQGDLAAGGDTSLHGNVTVHKSINAIGPAVFQEFVNVRGNAAFGGSVSVAGPADVHGGMVVGGELCVGGQASFTRTVVFKDDFDLLGSANIQQELNVLGNARVGGDVRIDGVVQSAGATICGKAQFAYDVDVHGPARFRKSTSLEDGLRVAGAVVLEGELNVLSNAAVIGGGVHTAGDLSVVGGTRLHGSVTAHAEVRAKGRIFCEDHLQVSCNTVLHGALCVGGAVDFCDGVVLHGNQTVHGHLLGNTASFAQMSVSDITVCNAQSNLSDVHVLRNLQVDGSLAVAGKVTYGAAAFNIAEIERLTVTHTQNLGDIRVACNVSIDGSLQVQEAITAGTLCVFEDTHLHGPVYLHDRLHVTALGLPRWTEEDVQGEPITDIEGSLVLRRNLYVEGEIWVNSSNNRLLAPAVSTSNLMVHGAAYIGCNLHVGAGATVRSNLNVRGDLVVDGMILNRAGYTFRNGWAQHDITPTDNPVSDFDGSVVVRKNLFVDGIIYANGAFNSISAPTVTACNIRASGVVEALADVIVGGRLQTAGGLEISSSPAAPALWTVDVIDPVTARHATAESVTADLVFRSRSGTTVAFSDTMFQPEVLNFTGKHRCCPGPCLAKLVNSVDVIGKVVVSSGSYASLDGCSDPVQIDDAVPIIELSSIPNDKRVFGVISDVERVGNTRRYCVGSVHMSVHKQAWDIKVIVNSVGEGGIWVANTNGCLRNGDLLTTSCISGYAARQTEEWVASHTVAKITCDCDFTTRSCTKVIRIDKVTLAAFVGCVYKC